MCAPAGRRSLTLLIRLRCRCWSSSPPAWWRRSEPFYPYYHPQRSCEGYVFTPVCLSTGGVCLSACWDTTTPQEQTPPRSRHPPEAGTPRSRHPPRAGTPREQTPPPPGSRHPPPSRRLLLRTVRIILEYILVHIDSCANNPVSTFLSTYLVLFIYQ